jgi:hypothetical protein
VTCRGENKNAYSVLVEKLKERVNFEDKGADGKTTLTGLEGVYWTNLDRDRGKAAGFCDHGDERSRYQEVLEFLTNY